ncbi:extensin precursor [Iris pallida]|uniref:Extensin n=1 Tax=Iris pallida TaxID=29817 RepID=A0AAX6FCZ0_IRIPA|nr:extensin precursor [Iris pallida]
MNAPSPALSRFLYLEPLEVDPVSAELLPEPDLTVSPSQVPLRLVQATHAAGATQEMSGTVPATRAVRTPTSRPYFRQAPSSCQSSDSARAEPPPPRNSSCVAASLFVVADHSADPSRLSS